MRGYKTFEQDIHPGMLRHEIEIGRMEHIVSENGYPIENDVMLFKTRAYVEEGGNQHFRGSDANNAETVLNFIIRYRDGITEAMYVMYEGQKWTIQLVGEIDFKKRYLGIKGSVVKGVN